MVQKIPQFETKRLFLKEIQLSHTEDYEKHFASWKIIQYMNPQIPYPYPKGGAKDFLQKEILPHQGRDIWMWGLFLKTNEKELIGSISLRRKGNKGNRGFWLANKYQNKGLITEAIPPVLNYAFNELRFNKMIFVNAIENKASRKIKEKTGCRFIKTRPQKFANNKFKTAEIWELTKKNWIKFQKHRCT